MRIDLNADVGEGFGPWSMGQDEALIPLVTSVNVACGFHAGDPLTIERTLRLALECGASIGAHPGYPDREGFGRRALAMSPAELEAAILYQVAALGGMCQALGGRLRHVKPHGALYDRVRDDPEAAVAACRAVQRLADRSGAPLILVAQPGSALLAAAADLGLPSAAEGFADRAYEPDGRLRSRRLPGAVLEEPEAAAARALSLARSGRFATLCVHGDTPRAPAIASAVRAALEAAGHEVAAPSAA
ncbi:MAG TPA: 5-oxoprolinase subunit PxpA [Candidatus Limnocylindrales bacterium]|nr:5-oxoprolinase subunit PxpA [Candidatus Limnocylindrales bacterium]